MKKEIRKREDFVNFEGLATLSPKKTVPGVLKNGKGEAHRSLSRRLVGKMALLSVPSRHKKMADTQESSIPSTQEQDALGDQQMMSISSSGYLNERVP